MDYRFRKEARRTIDRPGSAYGDDWKKLLTQTSEGMKVRVIDRGIGGYLGMVGDISVR
jgi:hypothetical protein